MASPASHLNGWKSRGTGTVKSLIDFSKSRGSVPLALVSEGLISVRAHGEEAGTVLRAVEGHTATVLAPSSRAPGTGDPPVSRSAPLALPARSACAAASHALVEDASHGGPEHAPLCPVDGAAPPKPRAPAFEHTMIYAFPITALQRPNCLLDLASAPAETSVLPGRSCVLR